MICEILAWQELLWPPPTIGTKKTSDLNEDLENKVILFIEGTKPGLKTSPTH
jgi:hypothetical protein